MSFKSGGRRALTAIALLLALAMVMALAVGCGAKKEENGEGETDNGKTETGTALTWPMGYQNNNRNGRSAASGPGTADVLWTYEAGAQTRSWAVIGKDGNVISGFEGKVVAVNPTDGTAAWEFPTGASASTCVVAEDGTIYVSAGNSVYALTTNGNEKWSYDMGKEADEPALGPDGTVYAGSVGGKLVALTGKGELKWESSVPGDIRSPAIDKSGNLYCSAAPLVMYAFDKNGEQKWEFKPAGDLPLYEGMFTWANTLDVPSIGDDGTIYAGTFVTPGIKQGGEQIPDYAIPLEGKVYAITADGQLKWEYAPPYERSWTIHTPSIGSDGTLYAGTSCWRVLAISPEGTLIWEFNTGEGETVCPSIYSPSIGKDGLLYSATTSAKVFCITPEGTEKWRFAAEEPWLPNYGGSNNFTPPPIAEDGTLFSVLAQGRIYAFGTAAAPQ